MPDWLNLGRKPKSKLAKFLYKNDISQQDLVRKSGLSRGTISRLCQGDSYSPNIKTASKIVKALRKLTGKDSIDYDDFFSM